MAEIRRVVQVIERADRGKFSRACDEMLAELTEKLATLPQQKGKGTLEIKLEIRVDQDLVEIVPSAKTKLPDASKFRSTRFFVDEKGLLSDEHPNQLSILKTGKGDDDEVSGAGE